MSLTQKSEWKALISHYEDIKRVSLNEFFARDQRRASELTFSHKGLTADFSRNHVNKETIELLLNLLKAQSFEDWRDKMFNGKKINSTENRAVLHTAMRSKSDTPILVDRRDIKPDIRKLQQKMAEFSTNIRSGHWLGATGKPIESVVNIGIGGSDLGPRMVTTALRLFQGGPATHFVANADAADLLRTLDGLDPATTLFIVASKTFKTQETLLNAGTARQWLVESLGQMSVAQHFVAASANVNAAKQFGIDEDNIFPMWDWVGGRFSLWSSVGLSIALALGWSSFQDLLDGAASIDSHFISAPYSSNIPVLMALIGIWYRNFWGTSAQAILPYTERLRDLPRYLQQLEMESNGKSVTRDGKAVDYPTAPVIFGDCGTVSQHGFHQLLHQGTEIISADFIGIRHDDFNKPEHHNVIISNMNAQVQALKSGCVETDPHQSNPGNRPSTLLWLDKLDPYSLGMLIALYEHKVFVQGVVWEINSFDQWGVELGKKLAKGQP